MNLQRFVEETISEIILGVSSAQKKLATSGAIIAPYHANMTGRPIEKIQFDVAVEASTGTEAKGGGINVLGGLMGAKSEVGVVEHENRISRISFTVPVCLPPPVAS